MNPFMPIIGGAMTLGGALLGRHERPTIDPEMMKMLFGPQALGQESNDIFSILRNSPVFSQMMNSASMQGTALGNSIRGRVAASGAGGSGIGAFASAAGRGYGNTMQRSSLADLFMRALTMANTNVGARQNIWAQSQLGRQGEPTFNRMLGSSMLATGANAFDQWFKSVGK